MNLQGFQSEKSDFSPLASSRTLAEAAANALRGAILLGKLPPGRKLSQEHLAKQLNVSRVPLREALQLLTAEGLVEWEAHRSAIVSGLSADALIELYALGALAEAAAAQAAVGRATQMHIDAIGALVEALAKPDIEPAEWHVFNRRFHAMLIEPANWPRFERIISEVRANTGRYVKAYLEKSGNIHGWHDEHREIYDAYQKRDAVTLAAAITRHWQHTSDTLQDHLRNAAQADAINLETTKTSDLAVAPSRRSRPSNP